LVRTAPPARLDPLYAIANTMVTRDVCRIPHAFHVMDYSLNLEAPANDS